MARRKRPALTAPQRRILARMRRSEDLWHSAQELGGTDRSSHSAVLRQLGARGLVTVRERWRVHGKARRPRGEIRASYFYALTARLAVVQR